MAGSGGSKFQEYIKLRRKANSHKKAAEREASGVIDLFAEHQKIRLAEEQLYRPIGEVVTVCVSPPVCHCLRLTASVSLPVSLSLRLTHSLTVSISLPVSRFHCV